MNVDINSNCKVVSKYFTGNTVMDESLDFQEKKSFKGPKNTKATAKSKAKKVKQIKGQKDIRTALKSKKNDLVAYSKDFDLVCKKSGIDVDSEQLQLAIALSKSLQHSESVDGPSNSSLTTRQRTGLIRSTLKEYGFKVPEVKSNLIKKNKKRRKPYKLLLSTDEEKQQIISDRYSQLLFELSSCKSTSIHINAHVNELFIYNMSTNIEYKDIKEDDVFYVENLIEKSPNTMGCLLKKWSNIPGRPQSPTQDKSETIFSEIECSQDEIDIVLSGSLKCSKDILKKRNLYRRKSVDCSIIDENTVKTDHETDALIIEKCTEFEIISSGENNSEAKNNNIKVIDIPNKQLLTVPQPIRSLSPDLFGDDDDEDTIVEMNSEVEIPVNPVSNVITESSDVMDLTECVNVLSQKCINISRHIKPTSQLSQEIDVTKRKSNDFMEMTDCVGGSSQPILERIDEHIDLTVHTDANIVTEKNSISINHVEHMDLTQSSNSSTDSLPFVLISGKDPVTEKSLDDTIILNENDYLEVKSPILNGADMVNETDCDDRLQNHNTESVNSLESAINTNSSVKIIVEVKETSIIRLDESSKVGTVIDNTDLTQTPETKEVEDVPNTTTTSIIINYSSLGKKDNVSVDYDEVLENMNSNSYCAYDNLDHDNSIESGNKLDKSNKEDNFSKSKHFEVLELSDNNIDIASTNDVDIVDINFDLGGISVIHNLPSFNSNTRNTMDNIPNGSMSESLPMVDIKGKQSPVKPTSPFKEFIDPILDPINDRESLTNDNTSDSHTPIKAADKHINIETPKQTEYIVKTDNVTPMLDYAAMTSPERNKELDKYGLKPFKRKRAIQLLTHLYNQTHPYVESTEDLPSPSKKRKHENLSQPSTSESRKTSKSPMKGKTPMEKSKSPRKCPEDSGDLNASDKEDDMFMVTSERPVIRHLECGAEDWVFQKREKAKVHTCRVPLHVAFHNFVSCRARLYEAILRYEPVSIDVIHRELAASGHRYDPKDLLKFMDKKCITVKTADNAKNKNRY